MSAYSQLSIYAPFDHFEPEAQTFLDAHAKLQRFPAGRTLISPEMGEPGHLYIVGRGKVRANEVGVAADNHEGEITLSAGECFPIGAVSGRRISTNIYVTVTEVDAYLLPVEQFHRLMEISVVFARFCSGYLASLVSQSRRQLQAHFAQQAAETHSLNTQLHTLVKRAPISVNTTATIQRAVEIMANTKPGQLLS